MRNVLFYRNVILPHSETFIPGQSDNFQRYTTTYSGLQKDPSGIDLRHKVLTPMDGQNTSGRIQRRLFMRTGWSPSLVRASKEANPDLYHAHFGVDGAVSLPISGRLKIPLIVSLYGYDVTYTDTAMATFAEGKIYLERRKALFAAADKFICITEYIRRCALANGFPEEKLVDHPLGVDLEHFRADPETSRQNIVLFVARLVEKKGCEHLIRAMRKVQNKISDAELVVIGSGPLRVSLEELAKELPGKYQFLGIQPPLVVKQWLNKSKVFCVPSITAATGDAEGQGVAFCEANAMAVPVVSSLSGGIPEVVLHGVNGLLAPERDEDKLADYLITYLQDDQFWQVSSLAARARMENCYDARRQAEGIEKIYDSVLK